MPPSADERVPTGPGAEDRPFLMALASRLAVAFEDAARELDADPADEGLRHRHEVAATAFLIVLGVIGGIARRGDTVYCVTDGLRVCRDVPCLGPPDWGERVAPLIAPPA